VDDAKLELLALLSMIGVQNAKRHKNNLARRGWLTVALPPRNPARVGLAGSYNPRSPVVLCLEFPRITLLGRSAGFGVTRLSPGRIPL
jgi:hypothetical protein